MKTPQKIFENDVEIAENPSVQELISEYENVCDALIALQQKTELNREKFLKILVHEISESIEMELNRDMEAERYGKTERVDFKQAVKNLRRYIQDYCRDYQIYF